MTSTATRATQHDDAAPLEHVHVWGEIKQTDPPAYLVTAHGPSAIAAFDWRYRACTIRGCDDGLVCGPGVDRPDVLAHLDPRLTTASATA
jgi:hypothetical protein